MEPNTLLAINNLKQYHEALETIFNTLPTFLFMLKIKFTDSFDFFSQIHSLRRYIDILIRLSIKPQNDDTLNDNDIKTITQMNLLNQDNTHNIYFFQRGEFEKSAVDLKLKIKPMVDKSDIDPLNNFNKLVDSTLSIKSGVELMASIVLSTHIKCHLNIYMLRRERQKLSYDDGIIASKKIRELDLNFTTKDELINILKIYWIETKKIYKSLEEIRNIIVIDAISSFFFKVACLIDYIENMNNVFESFESNKSQKMSQDEYNEFKQMFVDEKPSYVFEKGEFKQESDKFINLIQQPYLSNVVDVDNVIESITTLIIVNDSIETKFDRINNFFKDMVESMEISCVVNI
jgi:hypothetical protein